MLLLPWNTIGELKFYGHAGGDPTANAVVQILLTVPDLLLEASTFSAGLSYNPERLFPITCLDASRLFLWFVLGASAQLVKSLWPRRPASSQQRTARPHNFMAALEKRN